MTVLERGLGRGRRRHRAAVRGRIAEHAGPPGAARAGDRSAPQAPRLSRAGGEAGGGSGRARRPARIDAEDEGPVPGLQTKSDGPVTMLLVDFDAPSHLRALARFDRTRVERRFGGGRRPARPGPYGLHRRSGRRDDPLPGRDRARGSRDWKPRRITISERSETDSRPWRASRSARSSPPGAARAGAPAGSWSNTCRRRAGGGSRRISTPATRPRASASRAAIAEDDAWAEAKARAATTEAHELIDPTLSGERLLFRLFNERGVRVYEPTPLAAVCRCSAEGVDAMLRSFPPHEVKDMVGDDGMIGVTCEFCSTKRVFDPADYGT